MIVIINKSIYETFVSLNIDIPKTFNVPFNFTIEIIHLRGSDTYTSSRRFILGPLSRPVHVRKGEDIR